MKNEQVWPGDYTDEEIEAVDRYRGLRESQPEMSVGDAFAFAIPLGANRRTINTLNEYIQQEGAT